MKIPQVIINNIVMAARLITVVSIFWLLGSAQVMAQQAGGSSTFGLFVPIILMIAVFYFFVIRPQNKKRKEFEAMVTGVQRGDKIITNGGIHALVTQVVDKNTLEIDIGDGNCVLFHRRLMHDVISSRNAERAAVNAPTSKRKTSKATKTGKTSKAKRS